MHEALFSMSPLPLAQTLVGDHDVHWDYGHNDESMMEEGWFRQPWHLEGEVGWREKDQSLVVVGWTCSCEGVW